MKLPGGAETMIKTRVFLLSTVITAACVAGSYWCTWMIERLRPEEEPVTVFASVPWSPPAPVETGNGRTLAGPRAVDVRNVQALLQRMRASHDGDGADWAELCALADAAVAFGGAAVEPLGLMARSSSEPAGLRLLAVEMLGRIPEPSAVPYLMECLSTSMPEDIRLAALAALGAHPVGAPRASWLFFDLARADAQPGVRARATDLLGRTGGRDAVSPLSRAVRSDPSPTVRVAAATSLGALQDEDAIPALRDAASLDRDPAVRAAAVEALGNYREEKLREFFQEVEKSDRDGQVQAAARRQQWRIPAD